MHSAASKQPKRYDESGISTMSKWQFLAVLQVAVAAGAPDIQADREILLTVSLFVNMRSASIWNLYIPKDKNVL